MGTGFFQRVHDGAAAHAYGLSLLTTVFSFRDVGSASPDPEHNAESRIRLLSTACGFWLERNLPLSRCERGALEGGYGKSRTHWFTETPVTRLVGVLRGSREVGMSCDDGRIAGDSL